MLLAYNIALLLAAMEGREPPPDSRRFNLNYRINTSNLWTSRALIGLAKFYVGFIGLLLVVNGTNCYLTRNQERFLGQRLILNDEEREARLDIHQKKAAIRATGLKIGFANDSLYRIDDPAKGAIVDDEVVHLGAVAASHSNKSGDLD